MSMTLGNGNVTFGDGTSQSSAGSWSQATNGWRKLPDGTIIQWGAYTLGSGGTTTTTFPIAFPVACGAVITNSSTTGQYNTTSGSKTTTSFVSYNGGGGTGAMRYLAIGY